MRANRPTDIPRCLVPETILLNPLRENRLAVVEEWRAAACHPSCVRMCPSVPFRRLNNPMFRRILKKSTRPPTSPHKSPLGSNLPVCNPASSEAAACRDNPSSGKAHCSRQAIGKNDFKIFQNDFFATEVVAFFLE